MAVLGNKTKCTIAGLVLAGLVISWLFGMRGSGFDERWRAVRNGMTPAEIRQLLGEPQDVGSSAVLGAGNRPVLRWEYRKPNRHRYFVDFDYTGANGAPEVFRAERALAPKTWEWPWWWPFTPARTKG